MKRSGAVIGLIVALAASTSQAKDTQHMTIWKTPWCGCCHEWAAIMEDAGFEVTVNDVEDMSPIKRQAGIPDGMESCHTAAVAGYFVEGHVPSRAIERLLSERPDIAGIAVPGMPQGSPGMGDDPQARYDVLAISRAAGVPPTLFYRAGIE